MEKQGFDEDKQGRTRKRKRKCRPTHKPRMISESGRQHQRLRRSAIQDHSKANSSRRSLKRSRKRDEAELVLESERVRVGITAQGWPELQIKDFGDIGVFVVITEGW